MDQYLVDLHWLSQAFGEPEFETLTLNQQMAPQYLLVCQFSIMKRN